MENQINYKRALNFFIISSIFLILIMPLAEAERLPTVNSDSNNWGTVLNNFLLLEHNQNGTHKNVTINGTLGVNTTNPAQTLTVQGTLNVTAQGRANSDLAVMPDGGIQMDNLLSASASTDVNIDSNNELHKVTSSKRFKENIKDIELDTDLIYDLLPRTFVWNNESGSYGKTDFGLVAEEVDEIVPDLVSYDSSGEPYSVKYQMLTVLLLKEIQDLKKETDRIKAGGNLAEFKNINGSIIVRLG